MIKVPGHRRRARIAVRQLIGAGINVNITLLFAIEAHRARDRRVHGRPRGSRRGRQADRPHRTRSRASSSAASTPRSTSGSTRSPRRRSGAERDRDPRAARARRRSPTRSSRTSCSARSSPRRAGRRSRQQGARLQRPLWASTSTKNPAYRDVHVRRAADRAGHGEHDAARDDRRVPRSRRCRSAPSTRTFDGRRAHDRRARARSAIDLDDVTDKLLRRRTRELPEELRHAHRRARKKSDGARARDGSSR